MKPITFEVIIFPEQLAVHFDHYPKREHLDEFLWPSSKNVIKMYLKNVLIKAMLLKNICDPIPIAQNVNMQLIKMDLSIKISK